MWPHFFWLFWRNGYRLLQVDVKTHKLTIEGLGIDRPVELSVEQLKKNYRPVSVTSVVQCAGNRRADMNDYKKTQGLLWKGTAISNAEWTGVRLRDLLLLAGVDPNDQRIKHVHLEGADVDATGQCYGASITFQKAMSPETIIAYSMNGTDIPPDHGAPLRCVVPGVVGARQVKWLKTIRLSDVESPRRFPPGVGFADKLDWNSVPSIQEYPVQSAFCIPAPGTKVERAEGTIDVAGYAWSGGGRGIIRVEQDLEHMWAWTFFRTSVKIPDGVDKVELSGESN
ncbi:hypothetical protein KIN20_004418 [Parelaphostrongylus tenuis]|uniref:Sulfite oxidase n=1 Tax=Parelaphostrongylus tenuis TaxID=148309 RepID=A0AAD5M1P6_PARTN|nr:hypothetical protein KIN20_004418 [Parelaphostrongylus tenuis]